MDLSVRDIDAALLAVQKAGARIVTLGGAPLHITGRTPHKFVLVRDPDGILIELSQFDAPPLSTAAPDSQVIGGQLLLMVMDTDQSLDFYHRLLGFANQPGASFVTSPVVQNGVDAPGAQYRLNRATLPEGKVTWLVIEYRNIDRKRFGLQIQNPGAVAFSLRVRDLEALATRVAAEGGSVYSRSGTLGDKLGTIIIRDPNGFLIELIESREP